MKNKVDIINELHSPLKHNRARIYEMKGRRSLPGCGNTPHVATCHNHHTVS